MNVISQVSEKATLDGLVEVRKRQLDDCKIQLELISINGLRSTQTRCFGEYTTENLIFFNDLDGHHNFLSTSHPCNIPAFSSAGPSKWWPSHTSIQYTPLSSVISNLPISYLRNNSESFPLFSLWHQATEKYWRKLQTYSFSFPPPLVRIASASLKLSNLCE